MKNLFILGGVLVFAIFVSSFFYTRFKSSLPILVASSVPQPSGVSTSSESPNISEGPLVSVVAEGLDTPWGIVFLPDSPNGEAGGGMLVTERGGRVRLVDRSGKLQETPVATLSQVKEIGEGGLMGIALHPDFTSNKFVYFYYTYQQAVSELRSSAYSGSGNDTLNRVVRMKFIDNKLRNEEILVDQIPGASNHNGGRIKFGPDGNLYITTGDAEKPSQAQDKNSLAGKILRVTDEGKALSGNPFNTLVYSYGHRNPQGIAWDFKGQLWETEHGPSGGTLGTGNDEINRIEMGKNYGWPQIQGDQIKMGMEKPFLNSGRAETWAPGGVTFYKNSLFFVGLRGQALYHISFEGSKYKDFHEHFKDEYGRIREIILGPDEMFYITTSNKDGRGSPKPGDDKIIRVNPTML